MAINAIDNKIYTYDDYLKFSEDTIVEIIEGRISAMSPAPSRIHQTIVSKLLIAIGKYIEDNKEHCEIYPAPFDVVLLNEDESENGYEMPDSYTFNDNVKVNIYNDLEIDFKALNLL